MRSCKESGRNENSNSSPCVKASEFFGVGGVTQPWSGVVLLVKGTVNHVSVIQFKDTHTNE